MCGCGALAVPSWIHGPGADSPNTLRERANEMANLSRAKQDVDTEWMIGVSPSDLGLRLTRQVPSVVLHTSHHDPRQCAQSCFQDLRTGEAHRQSARPSQPKKHHEFRLACRYLEEPGLGTLWELQPFLRTLLEVLPEGTWDPGHPKFNRRVRSLGLLLEKSNT